VQQRDSALSPPALLPVTTTSVAAPRAASAASDASRIARPRWCSEKVALNGTGDETSEV
jgi:hypothetical protein